MIDPPLFTRQRHSDRSPTLVLQKRLQPQAQRSTKTMSCCQAGNGLVANGDTRAYESVAAYYGKVLSSSKDLKTNACCAMGKPHPTVAKLIARLPDEILARFYGCGAPLPLGILGKRVLDLGSGSGRDCYVCSELVGEFGSVTGVDMTEEQLELARKHVDAFTQVLGYQQPNMRFVKGHIEYLDKAGIESESIDIIISNCVVNLSPDKTRVLKEAYRVLAPGGEFYFSDVYCDRRLPERVRRHEVLWGECIAGALYNEDFKRIAREVGFIDPRVLSATAITINNAELQDIVGEAKFYSITYRLFKVPGKIESLCEDYGQVALYKGTIEGHEHAYRLDDHHCFVTGKPMLVCGNTAAMVGEDGISWLSPHFEVTGDRSVHYGLFDCGAPANGNAILPSAASSGACCC